METRMYLVTHFDSEAGTEEFREYTASSLTEALTMAERFDAGQRTATLGIQPEDYDTARAEGIAFNEADGLLVDANG